MVIGELEAKVASLLSNNYDLARLGLIDSEANQIVWRAWLKHTDSPVNFLEWSLDRRRSLSLECTRLALEWAARRVAGEPLQYILGVQQFLDFEIEVSPAVLIPRPETEVLVTTAIREIEAAWAHGTSRGDQGLRGIEIGIGSGAISVALLARFPLLRMLATDASTGAIEQAEKNLVSNVGAGALRRIELRTTMGNQEVFEPFGDSDLISFHFLISNPPYLAPSDELGFDVAAHEPHLALFAPPEDPLYFYRKIAGEAKQYLIPTGKTFLEVPHERASIILDLFRDLGWFASLIKDLTGRERVLVAGPGNIARIARS